MMLRRLTVGLTAALAALVWLGGVSTGAEKLPAGLQIVALEAQPAELELVGPFAYRQLLITGRTAAGDAIDLTRLAQLASEPTTVRLTERRLARPSADGAEELAFTFGGQRATVRVAVRDVGVPPEMSFLRDVQPALSKMSCNAGTCHGAKDGKNGFQLSLRGYDPLFDHSALTDDIGSRRFNRVAPDQSLMLLKASGSIPHVGGVRTNPGEPHYEILRRWIAEGARLDRDAPRVAKVEVSPLNPIVFEPGLAQQMVVLATYTDGSTRDVTADAFIESGDIEILEADSHGVLTTLRRGEAPVLVRYEGAYAATTITVMGDRSGFAWSNPQPYNYIDEHVYAKLERMKILPSDLATDEEFLRRVHLDLTGLPPTAEQVKAFLADPRPSREKRDAVVDQLVGSGEFVEHWTNKWADLLQVNRKFLGEAGAISLRNWIKHSLAANKPYDRFAREVLTASGSNLDNPPAAYWKTLRDPAETMENTTHLFLAVRFNCNKCHDHPFERWTQDQYYHLAAYFAQVGRKEDPRFAGQKIGGSAVEGAQPLVEVIFDRGGGEITHDRTGQTTPPAFPYEHPDVAPADASRRVQLAQWMTSPENQYFAKSYVNRLWGYLLGRGIIEPIDDIRAGNPPTNPELLDALTADFVASGFDMQHMLRTICKSRTYQHSVATNRWNDDDVLNYSHALPRRLPAEVLFDAIHQATGAPWRIPGVPAGFRAAQLHDAGVKVDFLDDFGRPVRESSCECERSTGVVLGPILKLVNGPTVADAIAHPQNALARLVQSETNDERVVHEVFLRFLSRAPSEAELKLGLEALHAPADDVQALVDELAAYERELEAGYAAWQQAALSEPVWTTLRPTALASQVGAEFQPQEDGSYLVTGPTGHDTYTITAPVDLRSITALKLEALPDPSLAAQGPGRAQNGNFVLSEIGLGVAPADRPEQAVEVKLAGLAADFSQASWPVAAAADGNPATGWAVSPEFGKPHWAIFGLAEPVQAPGPVLLTITLSQRYPDGKHLLGRFRLSATDAPAPTGASSLPAPIAAILRKADDARSADEQATLQQHYRSLDARWVRLAADAARAAEQAKNARLIGVQDLAWALINNPAFLFNR